MKRRGHLHRCPRRGRYTSLQANKESETQHESDEGESDRVGKYNRFNSGKRDKDASGLDPGPKEDKHHVEDDLGGVATPPPSSSPEESGITTIESCPEFVTNAISKQRLTAPIVGQKPEVKFPNGD